MRNIKIAIAGNPNVGKTTLLNALTGSRQRVGNWPGVTVDRIEGSYKHDDVEVDVTDLPGIYSFTAFSIDESIARKYILKEHPDLIVNILDATNLERNLFLTTQLLEMKVPMIVALNMTDLSNTEEAAEEIEIETGTLAAIQEHFNGKVGAYAYLLFILIYAPCVAAIAAIYRETNLRWAMFSTVYLSILAWVVSTLFYQIGTFTDNPAGSAMWISIAIGTLGLIYVSLKFMSRRMVVSA